MKPNQTIYLDLFSILATGIFVIMNTVTGPDNPDTSSRPNYTIVRAFFGVSNAISTLPNSPNFADILAIEPFFLLDGKEVSREDLSTSIDIGRTIEGIQVMIRGEIGKATVGFRVTKIIELRALGEKGKYNIQVVGKSEVVEGTYEIGKWADPSIAIY